MVKIFTNIKIILIGLIGISVVSSISFGQIKDDLAFILKSNPLDEKIEKEILSFTFNEVSEVKLAFIGIIRIYQLFISSQDKPSCIFTVSCSHFGNSAIQKFGILHGVLMTSDRIQRCYGLGRKYYPFDFKSELSVDYPIDNYYLGKIKK